MNNRKIPNIIYENFIDIRELAWCHYLIWSKSRNRERTQRVKESIIEELQMQGVILPIDSHLKGYRVKDRIEGSYITYEQDESQSEVVRFTEGTYAKILIKCLEEITRVPNKRYSPEEI